LSIIAATEITKYFSGAPLVSGWCNLDSGNFWVVYYRLRPVEILLRKHDRRRREKNAQDSRDSAAIRDPRSPDRRRLLVKAKRQTDFSLSDTIRYDTKFNRDRTETETMAMKAGPEARRTRTHRRIKCGRKTKTKTISEIQKFSERATSDSRGEVRVRVRVLVSVSELGRQYDPTRKNQKSPQNRGAERHREPRRAKSRSRGPQRKEIKAAREPHGERALSSLELIA